MKYIEAPERLILDDNPVLFLAGGITGCPDWQSTLLSWFNQTEFQGWLTVLNPRRANFPIHDPNAAFEQIRWEHQALMRATHILFWFPKETLCPIVLFELGRHSLRLHIPIFAGVHPDYQRKQDVEIQLKLVRPKLRIADSLEELYQQFCNSFSVI